MDRLDRHSSTPAATSLERFSWCLFDFANSAFNTVVITVVYAVFFQKVLVGDEQRGDILWARGLTAAGLVVAVLSPVLGAYADRTQGKKRFLVGLSMVMAGATALLYLPAPGPGGTPANAATVYGALVLVVVANVAFELMFAFYNAFLPGLAGPERVGRLSGYGWALGYVGGLLSLFLCLGFVGISGEDGTYVFGPWLPTRDYMNVRATNLLVAGWFVLFAMPMFLLVQDRTPPPRCGGPPPSWVGAVRQAWRTLRSLRDYPDLLRSFVARLLYNDALVATIGLSGIYMSKTIGMEAGEIIQVFIWLNVAALVGALAFGHLDDRLGARTAVIGSLVLLIAGGLLAILRPDRTSFLVAATLVGLGMGPNQSASRSLLARFIDPRRSAEFYGLFELSGKATVWLGPLLFSLIREIGGQRAAMIPLVVLFAAGLAVMVTVDERRGVQRARAAARAESDTPVG